MLLLVSRQLRRAVRILEHVVLTVAGLRADLAADRHAAGDVFSCAELIDQAADLTAHSAALVHQNERSGGCSTAASPAYSTRPGHDAPLAASVM
jgi:hypothetical protein